MRLDYKDVPLRTFGDDVQHTVTIDEGQRQMIMLALAHLCSERPGWDYALGVCADCFPNGKELYRYFCDMEANRLLDAVKDIGED